MVDVIRDDDSVEFFDGTARGELVIKQCDTCGQYQRPDAMACSKCHGLRTVVDEARPDADRW